MGSFRVRSVYLATLLLGRLSPLSGVNQNCAHSYARNLMLPFLPIKDFYCIVLYCIVLYCIVCSPAHELLEKDLLTKKKICNGANSFLLEWTPF